MSGPRVTDITDIKVYTTVPPLSGGDTQDDAVKQSLTLAKIAEKFLQEAWICVFTNTNQRGGQWGGEGGGGGGISVHCPGGQKATASIAI